MGKKDKKDNKTHTRSEVVRDALVLQLKLIVDGLRDLALMPVALVATIMGLIMHKNKPGRYLYRLLSYCKYSEKWIGLFDEAKKDNINPIELKENSFDDLLIKTQNAFESKYIDDEKKQKILEKFNKTFDEINTKINPEAKVS